MGFNQSLVLRHESQERNRLGRRKREIVENAPISDFVAGIKASSFMALSQPFTCDRIQVLAKLQEIVPLNGIPQTEPFRSKSLPPTKRLIVLAIVFANAQMLIKIGFRVDEIRLCLPRKHVRTVPQKRAQDCSEA
jgi:hypothetical protein